MSGIYSSLNLGANGFTSRLDPYNMNSDNILITEIPNPEEEIIYVQGPLSTF